MRGRVLAVGAAAVAAAVAAVAACAPAVAAAAAATTRVGTLTPLPGKAGCVADRSQDAARCAAARGLRGPGPFLGSHAVAISPDGRHVYVAASTSDAVAVFTRDPRSGALTQPAGGAGCVAAGARSGCGPAVGLDGPNSVAVSPDGRTVYATSRTPGSVAVFRRDRRTGALTQATDGSGCVAVVATPGCTVGRALAVAAAVDVSADGRNVYAAAFAGSAIATFARDASTGALTQPAGTDGCLVNEPADGCATGLALALPEGVAVSPDGTSVYAASALSNALVVLRRDPATGVLTQPAGAGGCRVTPSMPGCGSAQALVGANAVAISRDGRSVYTTSLLSSAVAGFMRDPSTGAVRELAGKTGCAGARRIGRCTVGRALKSPEGLAVSPDGATVYVTSYASDAIDVFARDRRSGAISQLPGRAGCLTPTGSPCASVASLNGVSSIAISPDGRNAYAVAFKSNALTVFRRAAGSGARRP